ncbi:MAG: CHASE2 domain-containing protein [Merismopedia sp. SIO2A8]|nr:CHASE2 domain-containing protein [Merismopedia sp. SIO2A8]
MAPWFSKQSPSLPSSPSLQGRQKRSRPIRRFLGQVLIPSLVLGFGVILVRQFGGLEAAEISLYDRFIRWRPDEGMDERILVVGIDETDIQTLWEYPLHDGTIADLLVALERYDPRVIALDVGRDVPQGDATGRERLEAVVKESDRIISVCVMSSGLHPGAGPAPGTPNERVGFGDFPQDELGVVRRAILVSAPTHPPDDWIRRHLCNNPDAQPISLALAAALAYLEAEGMDAQKTEYDEIQLGPAILLPVFEGQYGGYHQTDATDYQVMLNYRSASEAVRVVTLTDVMQGKVEPDWIEDRVVMIGYTSQIVGDFFSTPYLAGKDGSRGMPGVVVHAHSTSQLLAATLDQRPLIFALPPLLEMVWISLWAVIGGILVVYVRSTWVFVVSGGVALVLCTWVAHALFLQGIWIPVVPPVIALLVCMAGVGLLHQAQQGGYAQAIVEQLREQLRIGLQHDPALKGRSQQQDAVEGLVQRARAIRQQRSGGRVEPDIGPSPLPNIVGSRVGVPPTSVMESQTPMEGQTQVLYDQIKAQVEAELATEQQAAVKAKAAQREEQLQQLLDRARKARQEGQ